MLPIIILTAIAMIIVPIVLLCVTGHRVLPEDTAWSSRWYSALKRACCAWGWEIVAMIAFGFVLTRVDFDYVVGDECLVLLIVITAASAVSGFIWPRHYCDKIDRKSIVRQVAMAVLALSISLPVFATLAAVSLVSDIGWPGRERREIMIVADSYSWWRFRAAGDLGRNMIPEKATEIQFGLKRGLGLIMGASAEMRCKVSKEDLLAFAADRGYAFQDKGINRNECKDGPPDCDWIWAVWKKYRADGEGQSYPEVFLAYNYRRASCGGISFLYDVRAGYLYADWASN